MSDPTKLNIGDVVVGTSDPSKSVYNSNGTKIRDGVSFVGDERAIEELRQSTLRSALNAGGKLDSPKAASKGRGKGNRKGRAVTKKGTQHYPTEATDARTNFVNTQPSYIPMAGGAGDSIMSAYNTPEPRELETVSFENQFGRIRAKVEHVIDHELAFMLIFSHEDEISFEPKVGETLQFSRRSGTSYEVYYPGVIFNWTDGVKKAMILFKTNISDE